MNSNAGADERVQVICLEAHSHDDCGRRRELESDIATPLLLAEASRQEEAASTVRHNLVSAERSQRTCRACLPWRVCKAAWTYIYLALRVLLIVMLLMVYALLLMPGFIRMIVYYFFSRNVVRGILYGGKPRQRLDLYFPPHARPGRKYPVVIYVTGGAWTIGYKAWGALLARRLSQQGVLVACLDYRNFPQGDALDMLEDVNTGIAWVLDRVHRFGGDPDCVTLVGQSAGGHLAGLATIKQAQQAALGRPALGASPAWSPAGLRAFVGVSGAYDLVGLAAHRGGHFRGLLDRILAVESSEPGPQAAGEASAGQDGQKRQGTQTLADGSRSKGAEAKEQGAQAAAAGTSCPHGDGVVGEEAAVTSAPPPAAPGEGQALDGPGVAKREGEEAALAEARQNPSGAPTAADPWDIEEGGGPAAAFVAAGGGAAGSGGIPIRAASGAVVKRPAYEELSPLEAARRLCPRAAALLPYTLLIHGTADKTVPAEGSAKLAEALQAAGAPRCRCVLVPGKTHTAFLLEDPMRGGRDLLMDTVMEAVAGSGPGERREAGVYGSLCPGFLCDLAGCVSPF